MIIFLKPENKKIPSSEGIFIPSFNKGGLGRIYGLNHRII